MKYTISQDKKSGAWYCHMEGYLYIPVFGSIGDKKKALAVMRERNGVWGIGKENSKEKAKIKQDVAESK